MLNGDSHTPFAGDTPLLYFGIVHTPVVGDMSAPLISAGGIKHTSYGDLHTGVGGNPPMGFSDMDTGFGGIPPVGLRAGTVDRLVAIGHVPFPRRGISHTDVAGGMHTGFGNIPFPCSGIIHTD